MVTRLRYENAVSSECRRANHRFQRRQREIRVDQHVAGGISRRGRCKHGFLGYLVPVRASSQHAVHRRLAEGLDLRARAVAGNAHKGASFLEEEWLVSATRSGFVNRMNRAPG